MTPGENQTTAGSGAGIEIVRMPAELDLTTSEGVAEQGCAAIARLARLVLPAPVRCTIQPRALRVVVPRQRPGVPAPKATLQWPRLRQLASFRTQPEAVPAPAQPGTEPSPQAQ
jgi:hypothetical protein